MSKQPLIQILPKHGDHLWHVFMNRLPAKDHDYTLYEFKKMIHWISYGHEKIAQAFEGRLPSTHKQCSQSELETVQSPELRCAIGKNVLECDILSHLRAVVDEHRNGESGFYSGFTEDDLYRLMSLTCAWHILKKATGMQQGWKLDTTEGYMQDTSDRMFWERTYRNMAGGGE